MSSLCYSGDPTEEAQVIEFERLLRAGGQQAGHRNRISLLWEGDFCFSCVLCLMFVWMWKKTLTKWIRRQEEITKKELQMFYSHLSHHVSNNWLSIVWYSYGFGQVQFSAITTTQFCCGTLNVLCNTHYSSFWFVTLGAQSLAKCRSLQQLPAMPGHL